MSNTTTTHQALTLPGCSRFHSALCQRNSPLRSIYHDLGARFGWSPFRACSCSLMIWIRNSIETVKVGMLYPPKKKITHTQKTTRHKDYQTISIPGTVWSHEAEPLGIKLVDPLCHALGHRYPHPDVAVSHAAWDPGLEALGDGPLVRRSTPSLQRWSWISSTGTFYGLILLNL